MKIYLYKLTVDDGGAPCVQDGVLSLAICKPMIRGTASIGDLIFGFAANSLHRDNRLLYIAVVTDKVSGDDYYGGESYGGRSDCIYRFRRGQFSFRREALYHGKGHLTHDLGAHPDYDRASVLVSTNFRYFGKEGSDYYKTRYPLIKKTVEVLGQGHRVHHNPRLRSQLVALKKRVWSRTRKQDVGRQTSAPRRNVSHRSRSCNIVVAHGSKPR